MQKIMGFTEQGNTTLTITGASGTVARKVQGSFPSCTITIYRSGTLTLATIYSDNSSTAKANPFTAGSDGTWFAYVPNGKYDVKFSGGGISAPFTIGDFQAFDENIVFIDVTSSPYLADRTGVTDAATAFNDALTAAATSGGAVYVPQGTYNLASLVSVPSGVHFYGTGRLSILQSSIPAGTSEVVRLTGDYAEVSNLRLIGLGQGSGAAVDASRGIWIGLSNVSATRSDFCRVENCIIEQFTGNAISGEYQYAKIINNILKDNTDANLFLQPACKYNLVQGNIISGSRYSGIDCNGGVNRILGNVIYSNGTSGTLDAYSRSGILIATLNNGETDFNIIEGNECRDNQGCGIFVYGANGTPTTPATGIIVKGNIVTGHTTVGIGNSPIPCGILVAGCNDVIVEGNIASANRDNYAVSGSGGLTSTGVQFSNNKSISATRNGYLFVHSPRVDLSGDNPAMRVQILGNSDRLAAAASYAFVSSTVAPLEYTISKNRSLSPTTYCFNNNAPTVFKDYDFDDNYGSGAGTAYYTGFDTVAFTDLDTTPSVKNGRLFLTQNTGATTITMFDDGVLGQTIFIQVNDNNTTLDFTGTNLEGYELANVALSTGDFVTATFNGGSWYCEVSHMTSVSHTVTQATDKSTAVTLNWKNGTIVTNNAALAAATQVGFDLNNTVVGVNDIFICSIMGATNASAYTVAGQITGAGVVAMTIRNNTAGSLSEAVTIGFTVLRA